MQPSARLADILNAYETKKRKPSIEEMKKARLYWQFFVDCVAPAKMVQDVDSEMGR
jgi:hypothetical protein